MLAIPLEFWYWALITYFSLSTLYTALFIYGLSNPAALTMISQVVDKDMLDYVSQHLAPFAAVVFFISPLLVGVKPVALMLKELMKKR